MNRSRTRPAPRPRRGMTIIFVLIFLFFAAVVAFGINWMTRSHRGLTYHVYYHEIAYQAANSALKVALPHYLKRLNDEKDALYRALLDGRSASFDLPRFTQAMHKELADLCKDFPGLTVTVDGELRDLTGIPIRFPDPRERKGSIALVARARYREVRVALSAARRFKFVHVAPPVVSRFTLFLKSAYEEGYNTAQTGADGSSPRAPLALVNGESSDIERNGWIYMGGGRTTLHLARGEPNFGEDFHLPDAVTRSVFFPNQDYALLHLNVGFYKDASSEPVYKEYGGGGPFVTSTLRLFGCKAVGDKAGPTLVVGDVWRRYLQAAAVSPLSGNSLGAIIPMPWLPASKRDLVPTLPGFPPFLFLSFPLYQVYMSQSREEPFNRSFDYVVSGGETPPPLHMKGELRRLGVAAGSPYPLDEPEITIRNHKDELHFQGRLKEYDPEPDLMAKATLRIESQEKLAEVFVVDGPDGRTLDMAGIWLVEGEKPNLAKLGGSSGLFVSGRGALLFPKDVAVGNTELSDMARHAFSVVSLKGSVTSAAARFEGALCAIAEGCGVELSRNLKLTGFLATGTLSPEKNPGGVIAHDPRMNPRNEEYKNLYAFQESPRWFVVTEDAE